MFGFLDLINKLSGFFIKIEERARMNTHLFSPMPRCLRKHGLDFDQRFFGCHCHLLAAKGANEPRACNKRNDLIIVKHQRRNIIAQAHDIAHTRLAFNGHTRTDQIGNIAIDCALGNFETHRELCSGHQPTTPEILYNLKEAVGAAHYGFLASKSPMELPSRSVA